jgi:uncharacterized protein (DUF2062 family)
MLERLRSHIPTREQIVGNRWLRWLAPHLGHPRLWRWSRRGVAIGVALGVFFGLLIPVAQIPLAAAGAARQYPGRRRERRHGRTRTRKQKH